jgi:hypothetical protein
MAINPNTNFTAGAILTADQQNRFPRGVMALATSTTNYTLTTSVVIATGMTATFTAVANRNYKITYFEPQVQASSFPGAISEIQIRVTNAAGTQLNKSMFQSAASAVYNYTLMAQSVSTFSAGSVTIVGCATTTFTTGGPSLIRGATLPAFLLIEDIGPA